jgi:hypothetical protein
MKNAVRAFIVCLVVTAAAVVPLLADSGPDRSFAGLISMSEKSGRWSYTTVRL